MQQQTKKQNLRRFKITISKGFIQIQSLMLSFKTQILIDKRKIKPKIVFQNTNKRFQFEEEFTIKQCSLILGVLEIKSEKFLVYADHVYRQAMLPPVGYSLYQIANVQFVPFSAKIQKDDQAILTTLQKEIFNFSFYFSFQRDLTLRSELYYSQKQSDTVKIRPLSKFFWNEQMLDSMMENKSYDEWKIPVIQGHYKKFQSFIGQSKITYCIVSRRSKNRSGTRFYSRGIDENGNCSNTVQTEQMIMIGKYLVSTCFISGSSPVFWEQRSQTTPIKLTRNKQLTKGPFVEHLKSINSEYGNIMLFNLLDRKKQSEGILLKAFEQIFLQTEKDTVGFCRYIYFDINEALKQNNYNLITSLILKLDPITEKFEYSLFDLQEQKILTRQNGIYRVSCLDCLNRTNMLMMGLALRAFQLQLQIIGISGLNLLQEIYIKTEDQMKPLVRNFKQSWMQKADFQSLIYSGTRAASGRKDKFLDQLDNSFISIQRLYNEKFLDRIKQTSIDLIHSSKAINKNKFSHQKYTSPFKIDILTWNVNATDPNKLDISSCVKHFDDADLIVFGLQEMVDLHPNNVVLDEEETKISLHWEKQLNKIIATVIKDKKFIPIKKMEMVGVFLIVFISQAWKNTLRSLHFDSVKTGMGGSFGNKGGVVIRIKIFDTSICFTCAHLAAGQSKVKERIDDFTQIHKKAFQQNKSGVQNQPQIEQSDHKFFFGDLNFRIKGEFKDFGELFEVCKNPSSADYIAKMEKIIEQFDSKDQLQELRMSSDTPYHLASYSEQKLRFPPTYKLQKSTGFYTLEKSRNPSWCDRILFWSDDLENHTCECDLYTSLDVKGSDHRPVLGKFIVSILKQQPRAEDTNLTEVGKEFRDTLRESPNDPADINLLDETLQ